MSKVGIVTVTYNSAKVIDAFLDSLYAQDFVNWRLYITDNASKDDGLERVRRDMAAEERISLVVNADNPGVATANNQGMKAALADGCDYVLLINNDVEFGPNLISEIIATMATVGADMLMPKIYYFDPPKVIWCAGGRFRRSRAFMPLHFGENEIDHGQYDQARRVEYAPTTCLMVRADTLRRIGLLDENFFVYFEDVEFGYRALKAGVSLWYAPTPVLYHKVSSLTGAGSDLVAFNAAMGHTYFLRKHKPATKLVWLAVLQAKYFIRALRGGFSAQARARLAVERKGFRAGLERVVP